MENKVQVFNSEEFGEVRTIEIDNEIWFVGKDIAEKLGYAKPRNAIANHIDLEDRKVAPIQGNLGGTQEMTLINESGVYSLIIGSKLPTAKRFKHWITSEVLPTIRKTGSYSIVNNNLSPQLQAIGHIYEALAIQETELKEIKKRQIETDKKIINAEEKIINAEEKLSNMEENWKKRINNIIEKVCNDNNIYIMSEKGKLFDELEKREHCDLNNRLKRLKKRSRKSGTKAIKATGLTKMDVVCDDKRLRKAFEEIISEWTEKNPYKQMIL